MYTKDVEDGIINMGQIGIIHDECTNALGGEGVGIIECV
jgi:hypothetical protein